MKKLLVVLPLVTLVSACGGGTVEQVKAYIPETNVDVASHDTNSDGRLNPNELAELWNSASTADKLIMATRTGFTLEELDGIAEDMTNGGVIESIATDQMMTEVLLTHFAGITGKGVDIAVLDDFRSFGTGHGEEVSSTVNIIAPDANISDLNIFEPQGWPDLSLTILAWDQTGENYAAYRNADIINYSIEYQWSESQLRNNGIDPNWTLKECSD